MVEQLIVPGTSLQHLHLLIDVEVEQAGSTVVQHQINHIQSIALQRGCFLEAPAKPYILGLRTNDSSISRSSNLGQCWELRLIDVIAGFPLSEVLVDDSYHLIGIEVTSQADGHIVGYIPLLEIVLDISDRRILQMLLRTQRCLQTIGMIGEQLAHHGSHLLTEIARQTDVVLLIDSLQLGMETADDHILETVCLNLGPVFYLVRRNVLDIAGNVIRGVGIGTLGTNSRHQLVVFVRDKVFGSQLRHRVNLVVGLTALGRICQRAILLITSLNIGQQGGFGLGVGNTELVGTLEHQMLQIVSQTRCLSRVVLGTRTNGNESVQTGFLLVHTEVHLQTIVEGIDTCLRQVALDLFVLVLTAGSQQ